MGILNELASANQERVANRNKELAQKIADKNDAAGVQELADNLTNKDKALQSDCIKTLYEVAELNPRLIAPHAAVLIKLLDSKNNRLVWGAMTALSAIATECSSELYEAIGRIIDIADKGTVITKDHAVNILVKLSAFDAYKADTLPLLLEQILAAPINQMPTYAEKAMMVIDTAHKAAFLNTLATRLPDIQGEAKIKRLQKVIKKVSGTK